MQNLMARILSYTIGKKMRQCKQVILLLFVFLSFEGCATIKKFFPGNEKSLDDISFELIENLSTAFSEGKLQALYVK